MNRGLRAFAAVGLAALMAVSGCGPSGGKKQAAPKKTLKFAYVNWADCIALTSLAQAILEDRMGYKVKLTMADVAPVFTSVAQGDNDAFLDVWLPVTHASYVAKYGKDMVDLGYNYRNARIGLVVPDYVTIHSIDQLNGVRGKFNGQIIGIDSGAGIMKTTTKAIQAYGLKYDLLPSSGPAMTASLKAAIADKEWIVVTGWKPHWMFARWKLKFLEDPKKVYGSVENIHTFVRKGFVKDYPVVAQFLRNFELNDQQLGSLMGKIADFKGEPVDAARMWMESHEALVQSWIPKGAEKQAGVGHGSAEQKGS